MPYMGRKELIEKMESLRERVGPEDSEMLRQAVYAVKKTSRSWFPPTAEEQRNKRSTDEGREMQRKATAKSRAKYPERVKARRKVQYALSIGTLVKQPCQHCGSTDDVWAVHRDFDKPLEVEWVCKECYHVNGYGELHKNT